MKKKLFLITLAIVQICCASAQVTIKSNGVIKGVIDKKKGQKSKVISRDFACAANQLLLNINNRNIEIRTWKEHKINITADVYYDSAVSYSEDDLWKLANIEVSGKEQLVTIKAEAVASADRSPIITGGKTTTISAPGRKGPINMSRSQIEALASKKSLVIYIPQECRLEIRNRFSHIRINAALSGLDLEMNNGSIIAGDIDSLVVHSKFSWAQFGNMQHAHMGIDYGRFSIKNARSLNFLTNYSSVEIARVETLLLDHSNNDTYEIDSIKDVTCKKDFGELRIEQLSGKLEFEGKHADIKLKHISPSASFIKINNQLADLFLPALQLKNYSIDFTGEYATVIPGAEAMPRTDTAGVSTTSSSRFLSTTGNLKEGATRFLIQCASCRVDFY